MGDVDTDLPGHVERLLGAYLDAAAAPYADVGAFADAVAALRRFVLGGGKRIRPTFAWWGWRGLGGCSSGPAADAALHAAASLELIQACALVHDDLMDNSAARRGGPTVHVACAEAHARHSWHGDPAQYGLASAVLVGDIALAWADDMFASTDLPPESLAAARPAWRAMRTEVLAGQLLDVRLQATADTTPEAAMRVNELKTAAYTVARPLHLGAALAGGDEATIAALRRYGTDIGIAFQLRDDLLGLHGDPEVTGKPAGDDLREGKRTVLVALGLAYAAERGANAEHAALCAALDNPEPSGAEIDRAVHALHELGAVAAVEQRITELTSSGLAALESVELADPAPAALARLARAATARSS